MGAQKQGYMFLGWFEEGAQESFDFQSTPILGDVVLVARWEKTNDPNPGPEPTHGIHTSIDNQTNAPVVSQREGSLDAVAQNMFAADADKQEVYITLTSRALDQSKLDAVQKSLLLAKLNDLGAQSGV